MHSLNDLFQVLQTPKKVVITTHYKPDADALGSSLALSAFLKKLGHQTTVLAPSDYPEFIHWMPGNENVVIFSPDKLAEPFKQIIAEAELLFCLDFSGWGRTHELSKLLDAFTGEICMIDHHTHPEDFAKYVLHDVTAASTCELIYEFIAKMDRLDLLDLEMAQCIYAGMLTDTGSFRHPNTTAKVHETVAKLISMGLNTNQVHRNLFDQNSVTRLQFLGFLLNERLKQIPLMPIAYFTITKEDLHKYNSQTGDTEGVVNYALSIKGIKMAVIMVERPDAIKFSFRSVAEIAVNDIATAYFNGGGHRNASGGMLKGMNIKEAEAFFLDKIQKYHERFVQ
jgi:bifunctional oligoribonuclease and PAP phosphatase NrnA